MGLIGNSFAAYSGANAGWNSLTTTLQTGPNMPAFLNPFDAIYTVELTPFQNGSWKSGGVWVYEPPTATFNNGSVTGCSGNTWWGCVATEDGNESYAYLNSGTQFIVNMSANVGTQQFLVSDFVLTVECKAATISLVGFRIYTNPSTGVATFDVTPDIGCGSSTFTTSSWKDDIAFPHNVTEFTSPASEIAFVVTGGHVELSYMALTIHYIHRQWCAGGLDGIACGFVNFGYILGDGIMFFVNGVVFILSTIFAIISFLVAIVGGFFLGIFTATTFFLNVPNIPPFVGALITALFVGLFAFIVFLVVKVLRGTGSVG